MDPLHTYYLPARDEVIGAYANDPKVAHALRRLWSQIGHPAPGRYEGVSYVPSEHRARIGVQREGRRFEVLDVPMDPESDDGPTGASTSAGVRRH